MPTSSSNDPHTTAFMHPGLSQAHPQSFTDRSVTTQPRRPAPGSVSRSETGVSIDLSAASNMAANGEDPMELVRQGGSIGGGAPDHTSEPRAKSREAEKWFEDSNRNASTRGNVSFVDDDPPFHPPSNLPNDVPVQGLPVRPGVMHHPMPHLRPMQSVQSSGSEEFRAVIDDLTVELKKLKKENKQLRRQNATHVHPDKLFEVRMHGLGSKEKKTLMHMLRDFNDTLGKDSNRPARPTLKRSHSSNKPSSSSTLHSNSNLVDSAYASGSRSGDASGSQSQVVESRTLTSDTTGRNRRTEKDNNVRSYLMNMSRGLLPRQPAAMTEQAKKKLVVRKLEQLYTGKPSTSNKNSQSQQQQQVSTEAANEHKRQSEAVGRFVPAEGSREAVMSQSQSESDRSIFQRESSAAGAISGGPPANPSPGAQNESSIGTPDQRPTRPLDLDLSRAQNPAENIAYIRHLGFNAKALQDPDSGQLSSPGAWVPLNLLMNLAQLHTINVTPSFVKAAVKDFSDKFELSSDESKFRWKGGIEGTRLIGESASSVGSKEASPADNQEHSGNRGQSPSRSRSSKPSTSEQTTGAVKSSGGTGTGGASGTKTTSRDVSATTGLQPSGLHTRPKRPVFLGSTSREDTFGYQPIFQHAADGGEDNEFFYDEDDSMMSSGFQETTTGSGSGQRSKRTVAPSKEEGAVIFYHRARFCSDLSGDHDITPVNTVLYTREILPAIGGALSPAITPSESKGLLSADDRTRRAAVRDMSAVSATHLLDLQGPPKDPNRPSHEPIDLPVSGIGSTIPSDNFVLWARYKQVARKGTATSSTSSREMLRAPFLEGMGQMVGKGISERMEILLQPQECSKKELPPSDFPSPGFFNQWSSSESADGWSDSQDEDSKSDDEAIEPDVLPALANTTFYSHSGEEDSVAEADGNGNDAGADMDAEDNDEIDMLAYERKNNAEEIARREREFEEQEAEQDAVSEDGSEGKRSSVATVGDRSFLSDDEAGMSPSRTSAAAVAGQKREREELVLPESSPAKRVESSRNRHGKKRHS